MNVGKNSVKLLLALLAFGTLLGSCHSRDDRARAAFDDYQTAEAAGDERAARDALLRLVDADDSVADYWVQLGKVQLELADYGGAYSALVRAHELDQANVTVLQLLTQLELHAGNTGLAEQTARQLALLAPDNPAVPLTYGYVALQRGNLDEAARQANLLLASFPFDPSAKVLQARIMVASGNADEATSLLRDQVRAKPSDGASLDALLGMYMLLQKWNDASWAARQLLASKPKDAATISQLVESELRLNDVKAAATDTIAALRTADAGDIDTILAPWLVLGVQGRIADQVFELGRTAEGARRIALARFIAASGQPQRVIALMHDAATLPVAATNASPNALYGAAVGMSVNPAEGLARLDQVISFDSANADALRGRALLRSRMGAHKLAIEDAQKLVAVSAGSPQARLLLANINISAGRPDEARRVLWDAFHDFPANQSIYEALRRLALQSGDAETAARVTDEYNDQRKDEMSRSFT